jgi:hypothetical protein
MTKYKNIGIKKDFIRRVTSMNRITLIVILSFIKKGKTETRKPWKAIRYIMLKSLLEPKQNKTIRTVSVNIKFDMYLT